MNEAGSRSEGRYRLARLAVAVGGIERAVSSLSAALRVSLFVWSLGPRNYGIYAAVLGVVGTANLLDFGLHYGIVLAVAQARGKENPKGIRSILATGFTIYSLITLAAAAVVTVAIVMMPIAWLLNVSKGEEVVARNVALIGFLSLLFAMPLKVVSAGLIGMQHQHVVSTFRTLSTLTGLGVLASAAALARGNLPLIYGLITSADLLATTIFAAWALSTRPLLRFGLNDVSRALIRPLFVSGLAFLVTGVANVLKRSLAPTLVAHAFGPEEAGAFSVPLTIFTLGVGIADLLAGSLWPAFGEASARSDWGWISDAFRLGTRTALLAGGLLACLGFGFGADLVRIVASGITPPSSTLLAALAIWLLAQTSATTSTSLLNGIGAARLVMWSTTLEGLAAFVMSIVSVHVFGSVGVAVAMATAAALNATFLAVVAVPFASKRRARASAAAYASVLPALAAGLAAAWLAAHLLRSSGPLLRLALGALITAVAFGAGTWVASSTADRERFIRIAQRRSAFVEK